MNEYDHLPPLPAAFADEGFSYYLVDQVRAIQREAFEAGRQHVIRGLRNVCDGCRRGLPVERGLHLGKAGPFVCSADRYAPALPYPTCAYRVDDNIRIEEARQINGPAKWAVRRIGSVLNRDGEWEWEPMPSSRDDEFIARCRFNSAQEAAEAFRAIKHQEQK